MSKTNKWFLAWGLILFVVTLQIGFYYYISKEIIKEPFSVAKTTSLCPIISSEYQLKNVPQRTITQEVPSNPGTEEFKANKPVFPTYNETIIKEGNKNVVNNPDSTLVLVNKERHLPEGFIPSQLIVPNVSFSFNYNDEKKQMKAVAALALEKLFINAKENGHTLYAVSGYRSYERQSQLHSEYIRKSGESAAKMYSAEPGTSEHQTGLAMDVSSKSNNFKLTENFGDTSEGKWVKEHAHEYGFIIRYPKEKVEITNYIYEPWHLRYVGIEYATYLFEKNLALEEAFEKTPRN